MIAGVLHDVVEDTEVTIEDVEKRFGKKVAELVEAETVNQTIEWTERQHLMQDNVRNASPEVKAIKTADQLHQLNLFTDDLHAVSQANYIKLKSIKKVYWKYEQLLKAIGTGWSHPILDDAYILLEKMKEKYF